MLERIDEYRELLAATVRSLNGEKLERIDFDRLQVALADVVELLEKVGLAHEELTVLRQDYIARIAGMEKAVAVAARSDGGMRHSLVTVEGLPDLPAEKLVEQYSKTLARFRDAFPTSFGFFGKSHRVRGNHSLSEYK